MSKGRDETKLAGGCGSASAAMKSKQPPQQTHQARRRSTRRQNRHQAAAAVEDNQQQQQQQQLAVLDAVADLRFADDFAEYVARAEGGGSTYGLLRRHAFPQSSLRIRRQPTHDDGAEAAHHRQRRSRSLVPPRRRSGEQIGSPTTTGDASLPNHKTLLQALCAQTQQQQQRQQDTAPPHTATLQVNASTRPPDVHIYLPAMQKRAGQRGEDPGGWDWSQLDP